MTMALRNCDTGAECILDPVGWAEMLLLARHLGWNPAGTLPSELWNDPEYGAKGAIWPGAYNTNDMQIVDTQDALNLAAALERGLDDIPDIHHITYLEPDSPKHFDTPETPDSVADFVEHLGNALLSIPNSVFQSAAAGDESIWRALESDGKESSTLPRLLEKFAGNKGYIIELIAFCRTGAFTIN